jgi:predicted Zn-dependent protease with MMP-like domain
VASKITLFRGPLTRASRSPDQLEAAVEATLRHEIAHHLGISDARLDELGAAGAGTRPGRGTAR